jgi:hypothetical protein
METATNDPGEMAVLADAGHKATWASVWMFRTETHPADIRDLLDGFPARKIASRTGKKERLPDDAVVENYKIRPGTVEHTLSMVSRHCAPLANIRMRRESQLPNSWSGSLRNTHGRISISEAGVKVRDSAAGLRTVDSIRQNPLRLVGSVASVLLAYFLRG